MKRFFFLSALLFAVVFVKAQYPEDALRFSQVYMQGTARSMGAGGAFSAVGGDFTTLSTNPAGIAIFRANDLSASLEYFSRKVTSEYNGNQTDASKSLIDLSNLGYIISKPIGRGGKGWKFWQIGFGMNRLNNYNSNVFIEGENHENSRMDVYIDQTFNMFDQGYGLEQINEYDPFYLGPAWETFLLDTVRDGNDLYLVSPVPQGGILQTQEIKSSGSNNEYLVSAGANFDDLLYLGLTLGLPYLNYNRESIYYETDVADTISTFDRWSVTENLRTTGWGVNAKIGAILRPIDLLRIGLAYHTPTYYFSMKDKWSTFTQSRVEALSTGNWIEGEESSPEGEFKYKLTTPMKFIGSLAFVIKEIGFISAEYEYLNYTQAKFSSKDYGYDNENSGIDNFYKGVGNIRFGTEWRVSKFSLRAGYAIFGSPYSDNPQTGEAYNDGKRQSISGGIGYRDSDFSLDFAYVHSSMKESYYLYSDVNYQTNPTENKITDQNFVLTFKYFFKGK